MENPPTLEKFREFIPINFLDVCVCSNCEKQYTQFFRPDPSRNGYDDIERRPEISTLLAYLALASDRGWAKLRTTRLDYGNIGP